eukprot:TRINITY_DN8302_c0_g1_i3.p1 TRINITY_DN8302_c0_g1~~TRINITY_DN8302_c0_g1_i3.p1  ORF type:complete len:329 (+),score=96.76 TRINITY_DN8302_c0_g1_i3:940-1926(+)
MERRRITGFLVRLGKVNKALEIFLDGRSRTIKEEIRTIVVQGDLTIYIDELASLICNQVSGACIEFKKLFPEQEHMSSFIIWATKELKEFGVMFKRQVFTSETPMQKIGECLKRAFMVTQILEDHGLRLSFVLSRMFASSLKERVSRTLDKIGRLLVESVEKEQWTSSSLLVRNNKRRSTEVEPQATSTSTLKLTSSAKMLYTVIEKFMIEMRGLLSVNRYPEITMQLYVPVVDGLTKKLEDYVLLMSDQTKKQKLLSEAQSIAIIFNSYHLADDLVPRVKLAIEKLFGRRSPEVNEFHAKLQRYFAVQKEQFQGSPAALEQLKLTSS